MKKVKTHTFTLKNITVEQIRKISYFVNHYPHRTSDANVRRLQWIGNALSKVDSSSQIQFKLTKEEFRLLTVIIDLSSIGNRTYEDTYLNYEEVHDLFKTLEQKFIRTFGESVYADADKGVSTLQEEE